MKVASIFVAMVVVACDDAPPQIDSAERIIPNPALPNVHPPGHVSSTTQTPEGTAPTGTNPSSASVAAPVSGPSQHLVLLSRPEVPTTAERMLARVIEVSDDWSADGEAHYYDFVDDLRGDRARSAALIKDAYALLPEADRDDAPGRRLIYLLGHVAHETSIPFLAAIIRTPLPSRELDTHLGGPRQRAQIAHAMAMRSLHAIAARYNTPEVVRAVYAIMNEVLAEVDESRYLALVAADILLTNSADPAAERLRIKTLFGPEHASILDIEVKTLARREP